MSLGLVSELKIPATFSELDREIVGEMEIGIMALERIVEALDFPVSNSFEGL
jgi:hypothetical protein